MADRIIYAERALSQVPRLLSLQDRNDFSPTYGCFNREFWMARALDFPSSIAQLGAHTLAQIYTHDMPGNIYYQNEKILRWAIAGVDYLIDIQKNDGSFDEFYPNERGWAGPTGFLLYAMMDIYRTLGDKFPKELEEKFLKSAHKAGLYLAKYDELGILANHWAIAILPIYEAYEVIQDPKILKGFHVHLNELIDLADDEGWCLEYDGADLGYLSATVSFLAKLKPLYWDERLEKLVDRAIELTSYYAYPNGYYAGTNGSRQTLHFYPQGYEYFGPEKPLAHAMADKMLEALGDDKLVSPEIMADRYFLYRMPEYFQAYLSYKPRPENLPKLPYEGEPFKKYWPNGQLYAEKGEDCYLAANLAKGGVTKFFRVSDSKLLLNDSGPIADLSNGKTATSQWISKKTEAEADDGFKVSGDYFYLSYNIFTPMKMIIFRLAMMFLGWHTRVAYWIKGAIRMILMLKNSSAPLKYSREVKVVDEVLNITDEIRLTGSEKVNKLRLGDDFGVRYVPQSRYFQRQELETDILPIKQEWLDKLNSEKKLVIKRTIDSKTGETTFEVV